MVKYNDEGIRVKSHSYDILWNESLDNEKTVVYLTDQYNHTGYSQALEELTFEDEAEPDPINDTPDSVRTYLIGDDVITQKTNGNTQYLLYDGHGSTRQLASYSGSDISSNQNFSYDGYGVFLQPDQSLSESTVRVSEQPTSLLYAGEHFDFNSQQYYNRARWYNPLSGLFNQVDPYAGNTSDPQSLHKYLYCHANPVNGIDPSGKFLIELNVSTLVPIILMGIMTIDLANNFMGKPSMIGTLAQLTMYALEFLMAGAYDIYCIIKDYSIQIIEAIKEVARILKKTIEEVLKQKPYFVFEIITPNIYKFTAACLLTNPMWYSLTWHGDPIQTAKNRAWIKAKYGYLRKPGHHIDEFPYASTREGGIGARGCSVPALENLAQGGYLKAHYYGILRKAPAKFLVIPVPK